MHLCDIEPVNPKRPYWKTYKQRAHFIDADFRAMLAYATERADGPLEIVLNGDIFDFDSVTRLPPTPDHQIGWLARLRGLQSEEWMSLFKIDAIITDHPEWF